MGGWVGADIASAPDPILYGGICRWLPNFSEEYNASVFRDDVDDRDSMFLLYSQTEVL
jgi:hypothetical protein